jgi:hypothetical protein
MRRDERENRWDDRFSRPARKHDRRRDDPNNPAREAMPDLDKLKLDDPERPKLNLLPRTVDKSESGDNFANEQ